MPSKSSKRLVIDASVARASGGAEATFPTSKHCRDFLQAVLDICHRLVLTPDISEEWKKHQSNFARRWRVSMFARKKVIRIEPETLEPIRVKIQEFAREKSKDREAMLKDMRLIEAAMATDKTVISLDEAVRGLFTLSAQKVGELREIVWVNPDNLEEETPIRWLENGAVAEKERRLGHS